MSNYVIVGGQLYHSDELYHYGVKGMKWGVRKKREYSSTQQNVRDKKAAYKQAKKDYNKSFNAAYNKSHQAYSFSKKKRQANDERWNDAGRKAEAMNKAKSDYKTAKKDYNNSAEGKEAAAARRKKALKVGAAVAGTALAAYGAKKLHDYIRSENGKLAEEAGRKAMKEASNWRSIQNIYDMASSSKREGNYKHAIWLESEASRIVADHGIRKVNEIEKLNFAKAAANVYLNKRRR